MVSRLRLYNVMGEDDRGGMPIISNSLISVKHQEDLSQYDRLKYQTGMNSMKYQHGTIRVVHKHVPYVIQCILYNLISDCQFPLHFIKDK